MLLTQLNGDVFIDHHFRCLYILQLCGPGLIEEHLTLTEGSRDLLGSADGPY